MAYKDGFVIEYVDKQPTRLSCRVCAFIGEDKSCSKRGLHVPSIGYDNWRYCNDFRLSSEYDDCDVLQEKYLAHIERSKRNQQKATKERKSSKPPAKQARTHFKNFKNSSLKIGTSVVHKHYGEGRIIKLKNEKITVEFAEQRVGFRYPECIRRGELLLKGTNDSRRDAGRFEGDWIDAYVFHYHLGLGQVYAQRSTYITVHFPSCHKNKDLIWKDFSNERAFSHMGHFLGLDASSAKRLKSQMRVQWQNGDYYSNPLEKTSKCKIKRSTFDSNETKSAEKAQPTKPIRQEKVRRTKPTRMPQTAHLSSLAPSRDLIGELVYSDEYGLGMILRVDRGDADVNFPFVSNKSIKLSDAAAKGSLTFCKGPHAPKDKEERRRLQSQMLTQWINKDWAADPIAEMRR